MIRACDREDDLARELEVTKRERDLYRARLVVLSQAIDALHAVRSGDWALRETLLDAKE